MAENDLPKIISDEEFAALLREREKQVRPADDTWDTFNVRVPETHTDGLPPCTLEQRFPRIAEKITLLWRSDALAAYIQTLLVNDRDSRQGFPEDVVADLLLLYQLNEMLIRKIGLGPEPVLRAYRDTDHRTR